jgi:cytochrome c556
MLRSVIRVAVFAAVAVGLVAATVQARPDDDKDAPKEVKDVMKAHKKDAELPKIKEAVKGEKWDAAEAPGKKLKKLGEGLVKLKPNKGDDKSWEKLTKEYKENTEDLYTAIEKKDKAKAQESLKKLDASCKTCHMSHK